MDDQSINEQPVKELTPKQQTVEQLKNAQNILVTVSRDPSVDQLAACIGLTLMMNKLDKHATAVFSGAIPPAINFLEPEKTLEYNTDSLRDFIISLDKSKADKLRYKVEDDVVKIFITPYRTSISDADLDFAQGDFNVDVVMALGVDNRDHIDQAILEHGRILHDATVIGLSCGDVLVTDVGSINWHEQGASSLCEMLVSISESFRTGLLDTQMSTAFLTGIVSETERFSNNKTSPKVMTMSAQLMAAGANQQLIATQLAIVPEPELAPDSQPVNNDADGSLDIQQDGVPSEPEAPAMSPIVQDDDGSITFSLHQDEHQTTDVDSVEESLGTSGSDVTDTSSAEPEISEAEKQASEIDIDEHGKMVDLQEQEAEEAADAERQNKHERVIQPLNAPPAPTEKTDLSSYVFEPPTNSGTLTANAVPEHEQIEENIDPMNGQSPADAPILSHDAPPAAPEEEIDTTNEARQTLADLEVAVDSPHVKEAQDNADAAREAIEQSANADVPNPADQVPSDTSNEQPADPSAPPAVPPPFTPPMAPMTPISSPNGELNLPSPQ